MKITELTTTTESESITLNGMDRWGNGIAVRVIEREIDESPEDDVQWQIWIEWNAGPHNTGHVKSGSWPTAMSEAIEKMQELSSRKSPNE